MTTAPAKKTRQMPKGGRKGGSTFPRVPLADALAYAKKLVSKTHTGPQTRDVILMGVIGSKHDKGELGMSALRQYGLLKGDAKSNYVAEDLAKRITAAPPEELMPLHRQAALRPTVFKALFDTFHSDTISKAKLRQRAHDLKVHPDETSNCVELYVASMVTAGLVTVSGEQVTHVASADALAPPLLQRDADDESVHFTGERADDGSPAQQSESEAGSGTKAEADCASGGVTAAAPAGAANQSSVDQTPRAVFNVNVTLDSSLDTDKLERQLQLLKRYGAI